MKIAVIGAGTMGSGIAWAFAQGNYEVILCDISREFAEKGKSQVEKSLNKLVTKGKLTEPEKDKVLENLQVGTIEDIGECDFLIEAITEDVSLKKQLLKKCSDICRPEVVFASNTSSLSITEMAKDVSNPVVGMHFFNPPTVMGLVEVGKGLNTPDTAIAKVVEIAKSIGKTPIVVNESPGYIVNRILIPMINEAIQVLSEGVATAEEIDNSMKLGTNNSMGPLATSDLVGNDVVLAIMEVLYAETGDSKYRPSVLLRKMVRGGLLGRKTGKGFFEYNKG